MTVMTPNPVPQDPARQGAPHARARMLGLIGLVVAVVGAIALWFLAGKRYDDAVADLAPAPVGCDTTLAFDRTGTYTFFVETAGEVGELEGDCGTDDRDYEFTGDGLPRVSITLRDDAGDEVDLDRVSGPTYDRGGSRGEAVRTAEIDEEGDYTLTVDANADDVVVRVGRDPATGVTPMRGGAGALLVVGLGVGAVGLSAGRRRPSEPTSAPGVEPWRPVAGQAPPAAPPYASQPPAPPYEWPPADPPRAQPGRPPPPAPASPAPLSPPRPPPRPPSSPPGRDGPGGGHQPLPPPHR